MGDLNSYAKEDPIDAIKAGSDDTDGTGDDYTNLIAQFQGVYAYSYIFDGQAGYLDHALSNQPWLPRLPARQTGTSIPMSPICWITIPASNPRSRRQSTNQTRTGPRIMTLWSLV